MPLGDASYDIVLGDGLLADCAELLAKYCPAPRYAIITDSSVAPLYGKPVLAAAQRIAPTILVTFPAGEWNKTRETWATLTDQLLSAHLDREAAILALGGGVAGDLAGFVAATFLRGIRHVQIPTSLLAMIDSSIGGKTGVDTRFGKNLVGAFHQPRVVIADVGTLSSLPPPQLAAGMAEALKHGVITDAAYFRVLLDHSAGVFQHDSAVLLDVVRRSVEIKVEVVVEDEREQGRRSILNFGHTIAHALEATMGYELLHGEAVAIGMLAEAELGRRIGVTDPSVADEIRTALEAFRLPVSPPGEADPTRMLEAMQQDKKTREQTVRFALPRQVGEMARGAAGEWTVAAPTDVVSQILAQLK
ncbi:MAG: 3-dehydroquinate synthase [Gemmatimonadales bacterium]|nr:3-dehydroquinate synthase [Gemmatimonadales bacterium]NIN10775.1 3-dehydroquinate synthase [Gemmatimonadales bacterium]NIQ99005.1 3-dehydroquinate synthase [Gemmatimonadales bacterium]NIS63824.1 3-dehydroquinate synthase [Gemmatimonadales bacterium]